MNAKPILFLSCFVAVTLAASVVTAAPRGNNHFTRSGGQYWSGGNWHRHHHGQFNDVTFIGGFGGFPFWSWGWGYPYGYYGSYPYGYYGSGYYGGPGYGYGFPYPRTYYGYQGHNYGYGGYGHRSSRTYYGRHGHR